MIPAVLHSDLPSGLFGENGQLLAAAVTLSFLRLTAFMVMSPIINRKTIPLTVRSGLQFCIAMLLAPKVYNDLAGAPTEHPAMIVIAMKEVFIGLLLGVLAWFPVHALGIAGTFIDTQRGATMSEDFNPLFDAAATPTSNFLTQVFTGFFFASGGFLVILGLLFTSIEIWPITAPLPRMESAASYVYIEMAGRILFLAAAFSAPISGFLLLTDIAIVFVAKQAQQLNPLTFGMPIKTAVFLIMVFLYMDYILPQVMELFSTSIETLKVVFSKEMSAP